MEQTNNNTQNDVIDLRELFSVLKRRKKMIGIVTALFALLTLLYVLIATPWWQVNTTLEIGKYIDTKTGEEIYLENGEGVAERLKVKYIDTYKYAKDRNSTVQSISASKKNPQFITISVLGKNNQLAITKIKTVIDDLKNKHKMIIDEIIAKKKSELDSIDRKIMQIEKYKITNVVEQINYIKTINLPTIDKKIASIEADMQVILKQKEKSEKNLSSISNNNASLAALRLAQIQGLEYKISANKIKLIDMKSNKEKILTSTLPSLGRKLDELKQINLASFHEKYKLIKLSMQPHNYYNTAIIGEIITQNKPVKPKKKLIVIVAFITGLMLSVFLAFFLEFIGGMKKEEDSEQ